MGLVDKMSPRRVAVAMANNPEIISCIGEALSRGIAEFVLIGPPDEIGRCAEREGVDITAAAIESCDDGAAAAREAARLAANGSVHVLMKGLVQTADFVRAVLDRSFGLVPPGGLLSHVAALDLDTYHKTLYLTDAAITVAPSVEEKIQLVHNAARIVRSVDVESPKVACIAPVEKVSEKVPSTVDAAGVVSHFSDNSHGLIVDGPFGFDVAISREAAEIKGISSTVAGDADIILVPGIDAGNVLYKTVSLLASGAVAGVVAGGRVPVVLTSRADSEETKFASLLLALASSPGA